MNVFEHLAYVSIRDTTVEPKKEKQKRNRKGGNSIADHVEKHMREYNLESMTTTDIVTLFKARRRSVNSLMRRAEQAGRFVVQRSHGDRWKHPDNVYYLTKKES